MLVQKEIIIKAMISVNHKVVLLIFIAFFIFGFMYLYQKNTNFQTTLTINEDPVPIVVAQSNPITNKIQVNEIPEKETKIVNRAKSHVFFDLGANRGDTVHKFLNGEVIDLKNYTGIKWIFHAFEPNPRFTAELKEMEEKVSKTHKVFLYDNTAAWTYDGSMSFFIDTGSQFSEGSSFIKEHPAVNKNTNMTVKCVDVGKLIKQYDKEDYVAVKIDIEGAEYDLLLHFIKENVLEKIDYLIIEYHKYVSKFKQPEDVFLQLMKLYGIDFKQWY